MRGDRLTLAAAIVALMVTPLPVSAGDWPQILGPLRNGVAANDERLADRWPAAGPRTVWRRPVGAGSAGVAVVGDRVFLFHRVDGREVLESLDAATGATQWNDGHPTTFVPQVGGGDGPLCVPVVHQGRVVVFGAQGVLVGVDATTGRRLWSRDTHRDFGAPEGYFGAGSTPLVSGDRVVVNVGGAKRDAGIAAFALATGETLWAATSEPASYSAPIAVRVENADQVLMVTRYACLLVDPATGDVRWRFPFGQRGPTVNAASPVVFGDGHLLVTASYGIGTIYAAFDAAAAAATPVWQGADSLATQYATPIEVDGHLYAIDGRDDVPPADFKCIDRRTGRVVWSEPGFGYGTLLLADGKLLVAKTDGELVLVRPDPRGIEVLARSRPFAATPGGGALRALPAIAAGRLYVRDDRTLVCLDLSPEVVP
jgi:outer membrane protein assembly factor BamB